MDLGAVCADLGAFLGVFWGHLGGVLAGFRKNSWGIFGGLGGFWVDLGGIVRNFGGF